MTPRTRTIAASGAGFGALVIASALLNRSVPTVDKSTPTMPTPIGFRSAVQGPLTALANVSSPLVVTRFEPTSSSMVPPGLGRISRAGAILLVTKAYGFDKYDLLPEPAFSFGIKTPFPPAGDGQMSCPRAIMDGQRVLAAQRFTKRGVQVYDSAFKRLGEFGVEWTSISGELILDHTVPGRFVAYSIEASGLVMADVSGLPTLLFAPSDLKPSVYRSSRVTAPLSSGISGAGIIAPTANAPGSVLYSTGGQLVAVSLVDQSILGTWRSERLGLASGQQLRGLITDGANRFAVEAVALDGISLGVVSGTLVGGNLSNGVWMPRAPYLQAVKAPAFAGGALYVWEADGAGRVQLYRDEHELGGPVSLSPTQMVGSSEALYVADAAGTSWIPIVEAPGSPTHTPTPAGPSPTAPPATPTVRPTMSPTAVPTAPATPSPTPRAFASACLQTKTQACLGGKVGEPGGIPVGVTIDEQVAELDAKSTPLSSIWGLPGDAGEVLVGLDARENKVAVSGPGVGRRLVIVVAGRRISPGEWVTP